MPYQNPHYQNLLGFITSLQYTDFSTIRYEDIVCLLQGAGVKYAEESYILDIHPYTTPGLDIIFEVVQTTGHRNKISLTVNEQSVLLEFKMKTLL